MAWQSSGVNNTEMVDKLTRFGIISSEHVETGFRRVDRKFFVPRGNESLAHSDQPLKEGNLHLSAPHMNAAAIEALNLVPHSSLSFLNVGSGTGYMSCIVAEILGPNSLHVGVELHDDVILHCKESVARWKTNSHVNEEKDGRFVFHFEEDDIADIQIFKGNGLTISTSHGEGVVGFDRIYVGAAVSRADLANITSLLSPGGILVGPVEDEFVKVVRVSTIYRELESDDEELSAFDSFDLAEEFSTQILSGVMFAPLQVQPSVTTVIPATVWSPNIQHGYPSEFKNASRHLFLCSNSRLIQPPPVIVQEERINAAALLPNSVWVNILSFTHRKWFEPEVSEVDYLKRRLREEKVKSANAERARREAEARCLAAVRERALIVRWQSRLNALFSQHDEGGQDNVNNARPPFDAFEDLDEIFEPQVLNNNVDNAVARIENRGLALAGLRLMMQQLNNNAREDDVDDESDDISSVANNEDEVDDMEEDEDEEEEVQSQYDSDLDDFASVASYEHSDVDSGRDRTDSVIMDDVDELMATGQRSADQPRSISMSSDDNL